MADVPPNIIRAFPQILTFPTMRHFRSTQTNTSRSFYFVDLARWVLQSFSVPPFLSLHDQIQAVRRIDFLLITSIIEVLTKFISIHDNEVLSWQLKLT